MYYRLKDNFLMRGWEKLPYALVNSTTGKATFLRANEWQAVGLCDGEIDPTLPLFDQATRALLPVLVERGFAEVVEERTPLKPNQAYRRYPARYISTAHWSVTGKCNYRCKHCYMSAPDAKLGELDHETTMDIARQIVDCGIARVSLTGGEPLVRRDFLDIVDAFVEAGVIITTIYSNGRLVTDRLLDELEARGIRPEFNMSYDGVGHHDWLRGVEGAERDVEAAFLRCKERGFPTGAEMCIHRDNAHTLRDTVKRLAELGCRSLKTNPVANVGAWRDGGYGESISLRDIYQLYLDYIPHFYEDGMPLYIQLGGFFSAGPKRPDVYDVPLFKPARDLATTCVCDHARHVMYISAEGRALPCMSLSGMDIQFDYPLVTELGLARCISDSSYMSLIDTRATEVIAHNPACQTCAFVANCTCGCRAGGLDTDPTDILAVDRGACELFCGGWIPRIDEAVRRANPDARNVRLERSGLTVDHFAAPARGDA